MAEWKLLFDGKYDEHTLKVSVLDSYILNELYSDDEKQVVVNVAYVGSATGDLESFAETLPKDNLLYLIHSSNSTIKFFCLTVPANVIENSKINLDREITKQIQVLEKTKKIVFDIAETYDISMKDLHSSGKDLLGQFFINPLNIFKTLRNPSEIQKIDETKLNFGHMITLGKYNSSGEFASEELESFRKTLVYGKKDLHNGILTDIIEELSLVALPVVVFDFESVYDGLKQANPNGSLVKQFNVNAEPTGFPTESQFYDGSDKSNLWVDISKISLDSFCELFGIIGIYKEVYKQAFDVKPASIDDLRSAIKKLSPNDQIKEYDLFLAERMAEVMKIKYPNLFKGKNSADSMLKIVANKIGKITLINVKGNDLEKALITQNIISNLSNIENVVVVIPNAQFFSPKSLNSIQNEISNHLLSFNGYVVLSANSVSDLSENIQKYKTAELNIISNEEFALKVGNSSPHRVTARPTLSKN